MALDEPSAQLYLDIRASLQAALTSRRPILHHLNADSSWLLQIPRPRHPSRHDLSPRRRGVSRSDQNGISRGKSRGSGSGEERYFYNILIDPWLAGGQSDVASWFSQQFHAQPSAVGSIGALEELARETEILAAGLKSGSRKRAQRTFEDVEEVNDDDVAMNLEPAVEEKNDIMGESFIDIVAISHEFTDHCHKATLLEIPATVPVIAIKEAANLIKSWQHFDQIIKMPAFSAGTDWHQTSIAPLPDWLGISRLVQTDDVLNYHSALLFTFEGQSSKPNGPAETILYTPHGIHSTDLDVLTSAKPPLQPLALLHGLDNVRVGTVSGRTALQSNLGAHNGLKAQRVLRAKYWIGTHDEIKTGKGLVAWFLQREEISIGEALERERKMGRTEEDENDSNGKKVEKWEREELLAAFDGVNWLQLRNGESRVLV